MLYHTASNDKLGGAWAEKKDPFAHCLRMLSSPRISGNLEISVKSAPLHQPLQGIPTSPV